MTVTRANFEAQALELRQRVKTYGEVFTPHHMVERMLDLVSEDLETGSDFVDKTFLEPSAGNGNFLVAILHRKLRAIRKHFPVEEWPEVSLFALASIYGIEVLEDNHRDAKDTMLSEYLGFQDDNGVPCGPHTNLRQAANFLIETNIIRGDTLTGLDWRGEEIQFSWWNRISGKPGFVQRQPFTLASLRSEEFDFTVYENYRPCTIDTVHESARADA